MHLIAFAKIGPKSCILGCVMRAQQDLGKMTKYLGAPFQVSAKALLQNGVTHSEGIMFLRYGKAPLNFGAIEHDLHRVKKHPSKTMRSVLKGLKLAKSLRYRAYIGE